MILKIKFASPNPLHESLYVSLLLIINYRRKTVCGKSQLIIDYLLHKKFELMLVVPIQKLYRL